MSGPRPTRIVMHSASHVLEVGFDTGEVFRLPAEYLRVESPSAEVQGHGPGQKLLVGGKKHVNIDHVVPVGQYAVLLRFNDGHETGIYSWKLLYELGTGQAERFDKYLAALETAGMGRS